MRVLTILTYYRPHWTGLTHIAAEIAEGLAARGHEVTVLTTRHHPSLPADERRDGVRVVRLRPLTRFSRGFVTPGFPSAARRLIAAHDVVQIHTPLPESLLVGWLCRALDRPLVMTHQGDLVMPAGLVNTAIEWFGTATMRQAERIATRITTHNRDYAEHSPFLRPFLPKIAAIYPPVRLPPPDLTAAAEWRRELGLDGRKLVGFAGRFVEEKGFDYLLRAVPALAAAEPAVHLVYAGDHEVAYERFYQRCRPMIEANRDRITLLGLLHDRQRLADFYGMCDVIVVPSRTDCFAAVQVEALLCGTPVVCADIPGARVVVRETGMGALVKSHDPDALADGIADVLREPGRYVRPAEAVRAAFDADRAVDEYEAVLQDAIAPRRENRLNADDQAALERLLANEADMAFRRRLPILLGYLDLRDGDRVLDVGCGMGFSLLAMSRLRQLTLVGLDSDNGRLAWAEREQVPAELVRGDAARLPFEESSFDKVLASEVLEHLDDDGAALAEIVRVLRPGGVLAVSVPNARFPVLWDPFSAVSRALGRPGRRRGRLVGIWTNHRRLYTKEDLAARVEAAGLEVEAIEETTHYSVPFEHFLVYGVGKPLFERGLLPGRLRRSADRFAGEQNTDSRLDPFNLSRALFRTVDRLNERPRAARKRTHVNVLLKARKPAAP